MASVHFLSHSCESGFSRLLLLPNFGFQAFLHHWNFSTHFPLLLTFANWLKGLYFNSLILQIKEMDVQRDYVACSRLHSKLGTEQGQSQVSWFLFQVLSTHSGMLGTSKYQAFVWFWISKEQTVLRNTTYSSCRSLNDSMAASSKMIPCSWGNGTKQSTHTWSTIVASSHVTAVTTVNCSIWDMCSVVFKQGSAAFLGTCPEPPASPVAPPEITVDKNQYTWHTQPGSPFKSQEPSCINLSLYTPGGSMWGPWIQYDIYMLAVPKGRSPLMWNHIC